MSTIGKTIAKTVPITGINATTQPIRASPIGAIAATIAAIHPKIGVNKAPTAP